MACLSLSLSVSALSPLDDDIRRWFYGGDEPPDIDNGQPAPASAPHMQPAGGFAEAHCIAPIQAYLPSVDLAPRARAGAHR